MTDFGKNVRAAREALGWSQQKLADTAGISQTTIDKIERGLTLRSKFIDYIARALETHPEQLDQSYTPAPGLGYLSPQEHAVISKRYKDSIPSIPIYAAEAEISFNSVGDSSFEGLSSFGKVPLDYIPAPAMVVGVENAYGFYVSDDAMFPEFEPGDVAIVNPRLPLIMNTTFVLGTVGGDPELRTLGRVLSANKDHFELLHWKPSRSLMLPRSDWKMTHRVVAKYYRH